MDIWESQDFFPFGGGGIDRVIGLKWPAYLLRHPAMVAWLLHQHRPAHDLFDTPFGFLAATPGAVALRDRILAADRSSFATMQAVFTISRRVSARLLTSAGVASIPLYHPPDSAEAFWCAPASPYVLVPSRLESLKRQDLFLKALALTDPSVQAVIVGDGGQRPELERLTADLGIGARVRFLGSVSRAHLISLYAHATAVYFGPRDEDYGYVTLEAMLAGKPVVTCTDSGGPLEFVLDGETGRIVAPDPEAVADALSDLMSDPARAAAMGRAGQAHYGRSVPSWDDVVSQLVQTSPANETMAIAPGPLALNTQPVEAPSKSVPCG
jgi:glycosyltransferase involved in cell wall biosynthesis